MSSNTQQLSNNLSIEDLQKNIDDNQSSAIQCVKHEQVISELKNEVLYLRQAKKEYDEQIQTLQLRIEELEDWNGDTNETQNKNQSDLQPKIDLLTSRNQQLENDLQRLQLQQRNNQLAIERLDEYEETISQLQEELDQLRTNKKRPQINNNEDLLIEERKRSENLSHLLEETRLQLNKSEENVLQLEIEKNERENLTDKIDFEQELKVREMFERQIIELNEEIQSLENDKLELQQQLQSRDKQILTFQTSAVTPGSPVTMSSSSDLRNLSQQIDQLISIYNQFLTLLPSEYSLSDNSHLSLSERFIDLYEQFSGYIGTYSIIQEELDSLKQILQEKQDELEKVRTHLELTTDKLTKIEEEQSLLNKNKIFDDNHNNSDEDELEEILGFNKRVPSSQSLLSITPGEKQQLIAQNELLSALLNEKEQELILLQQAEKTRNDLIKNLDLVRLNLQQIQYEKDEKQIELNDIKNILDEKLRENSSLKKEKMFFIEKVAEYERQRQEQQSIQMSPKELSPEREKSPSPAPKPKTVVENTEPIVNQDQYEKLRTDYEQLLESSARQYNESVYYYNEYTRIISLYNELNIKYSQLQIDNESIQSLIQQKNEAYLQCQNELNTYQNLLYHQKKKSDDIDLLRSTLNERDLQIQQLITNEKELLTKQSELEFNLKNFQEQNSKFLSTQQLFDQIQLDLKRITHERDIAIVEKKQLENQIQLNEQKLLQFEERERTLNNEIQRLIQSEKSLLIEFETLKSEYTNQIKYLENTLEQERDLLREQNSQIIHSTEDMKSKDLLINNLQLDIDIKSKKLIEYDENIEKTTNSRVEKQLVKNILLSYFNTPIDKQQEVIPLLGALVGFTQDEYQKAVNAIANNSNNTANTSWFTGWLGTNPTKTKPQAEFSEKSFAELLIQYVDQQSVDNLELNSDKSSVTTSETPTQFIT